MAAETGNSYISGTVIDSVEIPTTNPRFSTMTSSTKVLANDWGNNGQPEIARMAPKQVHFHFPVSVIVIIAWKHFHRGRRGQKLQISRWNFDPIGHSSRDISISGFGGHIAICSVMGSYDGPGLAWPISCPLHYTRPAFLRTKLPYILLFDPKPSME